MSQKALLVERHEDPAGGLRLNLEGRLNAESLPLVTRQVERHAFGSGAGLTLDLGKVTMIDSCAIGAMVGWHKRLHRTQGELRLINARGEVLRALKLCNLSNLVALNVPDATPEERVLHQRRSLWRSYHYAEQVLAALGEGLIGLDASCRILYANPAVESLLGKTESELLGRALHEAAGFHLPTCKGDCGGDCGIRSLADEGTPVVRDEIVVAGGSGARPVAITLRAIFEPDSSQKEDLVGAVLGLVDVSDRRRAHAAEVEAARMEATTTLAAGLAHDFNNLMVGVLGNAEMLKMDLADNAEACTMLDEISRVGRRAADLSQQMLAFARGGRRETVEMDLQRVVEQMLLSLRATAPPGIRFETEFDEPLWSVKGDSHQMRQVVKNLLLNAMESVGGSGCIHIALSNRQIQQSESEEPLTEIAGPAVCLTVRDNGQGMDEMARARAFEPFYSTKSVGRGLGLAAVQGIVRNHGGTIALQSQPGKGAIFEVFLPSTGAATAVAPESHARPAAASEQTILIVDDEEMVRRIARVILERQGYRVLVADSGEAALDLAQTHEGRIDAVLLDIGMPGMGGGRVFAPLHQQRPEARIIVCSGMALDEKSMALLSQGASDFLPKPFDPQSLCQAVAKALDGR